jgi:hypothetical protein|nr:MAG TPA: hypothetical protein [Bacteriophage sp.]
MAQNPTKPTAIEAVKDQIARTLRIIDHRIEGLTKEMNEDYLRFFEWNAETMFKEQKRRAFYNALLDAMNERDEATELSAWLLAIAVRKGNAIVSGSLTRNSTNQMANHAHLLNLQTEQELITEIEGLASAAEYFSK